MSLPALELSQGAVDDKQPLSVDDLIRKALREQQELTPVERFAETTALRPRTSRRTLYQELIPSGLPGVGEQYAFQVDLDKCTGCKACVTACHNLNGLDPGETWRRTGTILGGTTEAPHRQTVTGACHHCLEPGCLYGCPVKAYEKDALTGIVRHLDDQCIGCKYCTMTCPYGVPQYNETLGIVRKCDMCTSRLKAGEAPACVQGCPNGAIGITVVSKEVIAEASRARESRLVAGAAHPRFTQPTTQYVSKRPMPDNLAPATRTHPRAAVAHLPLVVMLVLSQISAALFVSVFFGSVVGLDPDGAGFTALSIAALVLGASALVASTRHLGRPLYAFRAFLGWRTSWLSREIISFGAFMGVGTAVLAGRLLPEGWLPVDVFSLALPPTALLGLVGVLSSVMVYHVTGRTVWQASLSAVRFGFTVAAFSTIGVLFLTRASVSSARTAAALLVVLTLMRLLWEVRLLVRYTRSDTAREHPLHLAAAVALGKKPILFARFFASLLGGVLLPLTALLQIQNAPAMVALLGASALLVAAGELLERYLFFAMSVEASMPGEPLQ